MSLVGQLLGEETKDRKVESPLPSPDRSEPIAAGVGF